MEQVTVVGAGLAGCEATWQLVKRNIPVRLIEMRPKKERYPVMEMMPRPTSVPVKVIVIVSP